MNMKKILVSLFAGLVGVTALTVSSIAADTDIFEVGADKDLKTWSDAVDAAKDEDGDGEITYHIYGKVEVDKVGWVSPKGTSGATTVNLIGKTTDAEISISQTEATIIVTDVEKVNYKDLILSKTNGFTAYDYGHANNYYTTWITSANALVTYEDCVFPNGSSNNQYGKTTYTDCTFNNPVEYALWIYGGEVVVTGGTFEAKKGVKTFSEGNAEITTTISGATFDIESKPAIVSSSIGTLTISDVNADACKYGLLTSEAHGHIVANGLADITVDGKAPVYAAIVNGEYHSSLEYAIEEDRGKVEIPVARIGSDYYASLKAALVASAGMDSAEITVFEGEYSIADLTLGSSIREYPFADNLSIVANGDVTFNLDSETKSYQNGKAYQYFVGGSWYVCGESIAFEGIDFVFVDTNTEDNMIMAELQTYGSESISYTNCTFDKVSVSPWGDNQAGYVAEATISGCEFKNIETRSAIQQSKALELVVTGNEFEDVVSGIHISVDALESLTVTNNTFDGLAEGSSAIYFGNESWNGVWVGDYSEATIVVTGNTADGSLVRNSNESLTMSHINALADTTANTFETAFTESSVDFVVAIGETGYTSLADAIADADDGAIIDLLGNTIEIDVYQDSYHKNKSLTIKNGTLDFSKAGAPTALFWLSGNQTLIFENVNIIKRDIGTERKFMYNLIQIASPSASVSFVDCDIDLDGGYDSTNKVGMASSYIANDGNGTMYFTRCNIECEYTNLVYRGGATFDSCTFDGYAERDDGEAIAGSGNFIMWAANPCVVKNSTVNTRTLSVITANGTIDIVEGSAVEAELVRHYYASTAAEYSKNNITVDATSSLKAETINLDLINTEDSEGTIVSKADTIEVVFEKVDAEEVNGVMVDTAEGEDLYNINLVGANAETINRLNSADLTFKLTSNHDMAFTIVDIADDNIVVNPVNNSDDRYEFHFGTKTNVENDTANTITIAQVKFEGYGEYDFVIVDNETNAVHATTIADNIVDTFIPGGAAEGKGELVITNAITDAYIAVPTRDLKINIDFPNSIEEQVIAYNNMKVVVSGGDLANAITIELGSDAVATDIDTENDKADAQYVADFVDGAYVVEITDVLTVNNSYNVEVSGAGYRTARYTVTMNCEDYKTLNFWNNVKDNAIAIEAGKNTMKTNFLAGDIVKDNNINIYDLSAVVSYFGEINLATTAGAEKYAKYDLNRDGKIDSKDVAYVLVSWNN